VRICLDTSALLKRYFDEQETAEFEGLFDAADHVMTSRLTLLEALAAIKKAGRIHNWNDEQVGGLEAALFADADLSFEVVPLTDALVMETILKIRDDLLLPLRAADAIHIQTALHADVDAFVTADRQQGAAAEALGLEVRRL